MGILKNVSGGAFLALVFSGSFLVMSGVSGCRVTHARVGYMEPGQLQKIDNMKSSKKCDWLFTYKGNLLGETFKNLAGQSGALENVRLLAEGKLPPCYIVETPR